jgi:hypothetical protein
MSENTDRKDGPKPASNYDPAIARAIDWLGDRYLLARAINVTVKRQKAGAVATTPSLPIDGSADPTPAKAPDAKGS